MKSPSSMTQDRLDNELLHHVVHLGPDIESSELKGLPDKEYIVTGCLIKDGHLQIGLMDIDYDHEKDPTQWRTFLLCGKCLEKVFDLLVPVRVHDPIVLEALVKWGPLEDESNPESQRETFAAVFVDKGIPDTPVHKYPSTVQEGDIFYQAAWIETNGKMRTQAWGLEPTQFDGKTREEVHVMLRMFRDFIKSGRYLQQQSP